MELPNGIAEKIKKYCETHPEKPESCKFCIFEYNGGCELHSTELGFPSDWETEVEIKI